MTPDARVQEIRDATATDKWGVHGYREACRDLLSTLDARERRIEELEKEPVITLPEGKNVSLGELVELYEDYRTLLGRLVEAAAEYRRLSNCFKNYPDRYREEWWKAGALLLDALTDARRALGERG